ncbi:hypothetical protein TRVL_07808 [Trypanosoma vivax]|nr:hypothetical protein TRVL_07808 [Trypanosoma vivax]
MSEEARVAYIDGVAVPRILARSQWEPLFPNLIRGVLREHRDGGAFICPDAEGTFILDGGKEYVIYFQSLGAGDVQSHMSDSNASYDSSRSHGPVTISSLAESNGLSATSTPGSGGSGSLTQKKALYMRPPTLRPLDNALTNTETVDVLPSQTAIKHCDAQGQESENPAHVRAGDDVGNISIAPYSRPPENNVDLLCGKYLQDRVHEYVFLPALAVKIMDTPEFQHLRSLKQLGPTDYIYPSTTHTRFEHSIGVAHLASELLVCIARRQPELKINKKDILSVVVAGLCHDLGHGPFSHLFENLVNRYRAKKGEKEVFSHENMSIRLLRRILSRISLDQFGLDEDDARFIELCIVGLSPGTPWPTNVGRSPEKRFLVDVIANKRNGVDMDRLDYFMRDSIACYGRAAFDVHIPRLFSASKVFCFEGEHQICFEEKTALSLVKMFTVRANLHKHVYQHRVVVVLCHMISDALLEAESHLSFRGSNNKTFTLAESVNDDEAYCKLGDWIVDFIAASTSKGTGKGQIYH